MQCIFGLCIMTLLLISFTFIFLQFQIISSISLLILHVGLFVLIAVFNAVSMYSLFTSFPGQATPITTGIQDVFESQNRQQQRVQLIKKLKSSTISNKAQIQSKLISLYKLPGYCQQCKSIRLPRSHHCQICNKCISRFQFHNRFLGVCIGQKNIKNYLQFLIFSCLVCLIVVTVCIATYIRHGYEMQLKEKTNIWMFLVLVVFCSLLCCFLFAQMSTRFQNIARNITTYSEKSRNQDIQNVFNENFYRILFPSIKDIFKITLETQTPVVQLIEQGSIY